MDSPSIWSKLQYFTEKEPWGDPGKMDEDLLISLDHYRHVVGFPFQVLCGYASSGHAPMSYHYKGRAVDGRFYRPDQSGPLSIAEHIMIALKAPFGGVGIYTWGAGGPFLHFDNRIAIFDRKIWVSEKEGEYVNLSPEFLKKYL